MGRRPQEIKPSFMKILVKDFSKKLLIAPKFVRLHRGTLARKCMLRPTGTQDLWPVKTKQINNLLYFKKGWEEFAEHHSLGYGNLLVFRYAQDCEFDVDMFDKSCCNKEPVPSQNVGSRKDTSILPNLEKKSNLKTPAIDTAEEFMASSEFPAFSRIMKSSYMRFGGYMPIQLDFAKKYLKDSTRVVKIEVSGKTWTVGIARGCTCRLNRCWGYLATQNALKAGDVCVFQLINTEDCTFKLSIFRSTRENINCQTRARSGKALEAHSSPAVEAHSSQAFELAYRFSSVSKYPSYLCVMASSYIRKSYTYVPSTFVKQLNAAAGAIKVKLQGQGKKWDAVVSSHRNGSRINNGWSIFARENSLQIGDACVFELINQKDALIRVTIFKCTN